MNFSFGTPKTTGGFPLSSSSSTPVVSNPSLNFAGGDNKGLPNSQSGVKSSSFNVPFGTNVSNPGFPINASTSAAPTLSFGGNTTSQNLSFNAASTAAASTSATSTLTGFSLGSSLAQPSTPNVLSGSLPTATSIPAMSLATPAINTNLNVASTTTTASGFTLGGISSTGLTLGTPAISSTLGNSFASGKVSTASTSAAAGLSSTTTSGAGPLVSTTASITAGTPGGSFTFTQLEEALNKWTLELEDQGKMFINQALQINAWDRLVIANGEKILTLNNGIEKVKQQQQQLDHELDFVLAQQRELEECIVPLEKELKDIPITDQDRNHTYQMAENMDSLLKQMSEDLKEIIEHLNESNKTEDTNDPVAQIGRILNAHMNSLQWIDRNTAQISTFLDQISKMHDMHRRDNERSFHLTYE